MNKLNVGDRVTYRAGSNPYGACYDDGEIVIVKTVAEIDFDVIGVYSPSSKIPQSIHPEQVGAKAPAKVITKGTQNWALLQHFLSGRSISRIEADHLYRIASLTRRIRDLRDAGHKITADRLTDPTGRPYVRYSLRNVGKVAA